MFTKKITNLLKTFINSNIRKPKINSGQKKPKIKQKILLQKIKNINKKENKKENKSENKEMKKKELDFKGIFDSIKNSEKTINVLKTFQNYLNNKKQKQEKNTENENKKKQIEEKMFEKLKKRQKQKEIMQIIKQKQKKIEKNFLNKMINIKKDQNFIKNPISFTKTNIEQNVTKAKILSSHKKSEKTEKTIKIVKKKKDIFLIKTENKKWTDIIEDFYKIIITNIRLIKKEINFYILEEDNISIKSYCKKKRIKEDIFKLVPFSFFLWVPFSEFILPLYLMMFPNSIPTQFISNKNLMKKMKRKIIIQDFAHISLYQKLKNMYPEDFVQLEAILESVKKNPNSKLDLDALAKIDKLIRDKLRDNLNRSYVLNYRNLFLHERKNLLMFFFLDFYSGDNLIHSIINFPIKILYYTNKYIFRTNPKKPKYYKDQIYFFPVYFMKKRLYRKQLDRHFLIFDKENRLLRKNQNFNGIDLIDAMILCRKRGLGLKDVRSSKRFLNSFLSEEHEDRDYLIWCTVLRFSYAKYFFRERGKR